MLIATAAAVALAVRYESIAVALLGLLGYLTRLLIKPSDAALDVYVTILSGSALWLARRYAWRAVEVFALAFTVVLYATTIFHANFDRLLASAFLILFAGLFTAARTPALVDAAHSLAMLALVRVWGHSPRIYLLSTLALVTADLAIAVRLASRSLPGAALAAYWIAFALWSPRPYDASFFAVTLVFLIYFIWTVRLRNYGRLGRGSGRARMDGGIARRPARHVCVLGGAVPGISSARAGRRLDVSRPARLCGCDQCAISVIRRGRTGGMGGVAVDDLARVRSDRLCGRAHRPTVGLGFEVAGWAARAAAPANRASLVAASISILLAVYALVLIAAGVSAASAVNRALGLVLIGAVVVKLYAYDVWLLRTLYRTTAFIALGAVLVASSYVYSRYRDRIEEWWRDRAKTGDGNTAPVS